MAAVAGEASKTRTLPDEADAGADRTAEEPPAEPESRAEVVEDAPEVRPARVAAGGEPKSAGAEPAQVHKRRGIRLLDDMDAD